MTLHQHVDALFGQTVELNRLTHLYALAERLNGRRKMSRVEELQHAEGLEGVEYSWASNTKPQRDGVVPEADEADDLSVVARRALEGDRRSRAVLLDAYACMQANCKKMDLTRHASQVAEAYLARELRRLARHEWERGLSDGPASQLVNDLPRLARLAREYGIDVVEAGAVDRWRKRFASHPA